MYAPNGTSISCLSFWGSLQIWRHLTSCPSQWHPMEIGDLSPCRRQNLLQQFSSLQVFKTLVHCPHVMSEAEVAQYCKQKKQVQYVRHSVRQNQHTTWKNANQPASCHEPPCLLFQYPVPSPYPGVTCNAEHAAAAAASRQFSDPLPWKGENGPAETWDFLFSMGFPWDFHGFVAMNCDGSQPKSPKAWASSTSFFASVASPPGSCPALMHIR